MATFDRLLTTKDRSKHLFIRETQGQEKTFLYDVEETFVYSLKSEGLCVRHERPISKATINLSREKLQTM